MCVRVTSAADVVAHVITTGMTSAILIHSLNLTLISASKRQLDAFIQCMGTDTHRQAVLSLYPLEITTASLVCLQAAAHMHQDCKL